ncbi:hypothetical protein HI914_07428 [Erysiphe necator]|nr:hypothetical protein HI914_07428 [Erysiphe necator]
MERTTLSSLDFGTVDISHWSNEVRSSNTGLTTSNVNKYHTQHVSWMEYYFSNIKIFDACQRMRDGNSLNYYLPQGNAKIEKI